MKRILLPAMVAGSFVASGGAQAGTVTANMPVQMVIAASCTVSAATLNFGTQTLIDIGSDIDTSANLTVTCTNEAPYYIQLNAGLNDGAAGINARKMKIGATSDTVNYQLYRDSGRTQVWGITNGGGSPDVYSDMGNGDAQIIPVFGRVPTGQTNPKIGTYNDTITVTVNY
jgi:spore coat protein U-like protein